ncbi:hypothetical protein JCM24511_05281 [Saitozyma sp. JCM 24511]|nr:hypothetical protein JCM24511_05281 [Saitozyma sp. JCM 24511]
MGRDGAGDSGSLAKNSSSSDGKGPAKVLQQNISGNGMSARITAAEGRAEGKGKAEERKDCEK